MRKKWMVCMIACLMILFAGCNGNTAKETARNDTDKRISWVALAGASALGIVATVVASKRKKKKEGNE